MTTSGLFSLSCLLLLLQALTSASGQRNQRVRMCYLTSWSQKRCDYPFNVFTNLFHPFLCTHIIYAFAHVNPVDNRLDMMDWEMNEMMEFPSKVQSLKTINPSLKILLAVGGYRDGTATFEAVASDDAKRSQFINNTVQFLRIYRFDGLDLDWEYPNKLTSSSYSHFVQDLWSKFKEEGLESGMPRLILTVAVSANHEIASDWYGSLIEHQSKVDYILLMTYDYWGTWAPRLAHHSPLNVRPGDRDDPDLGRFSMMKTVNEWLRLGAQRGKLVLGFSTYGRTGLLINADQHNLGDPYTQQTGSPGRLTQTPGFLSYPEICEKLADSNKKWTASNINMSPAPYAHSSSCPQDFVCYDNPSSFRTKAQYVIDENLAGAMIWSLDNDDFSGQFCDNGSYPLTSSIAAVFENYQPSTFTSSTSATTATKTVKKSATTIESTATMTTKPPKTKGCMTSAELRCKTQFELYADCNNCSRYFHCDKGLAWGKECPPGLRFNSEASVCDWPQNVACP